MKELSLHILDLVENSINAEAKHITIFIFEDILNNLLTISIEDDGKGMEASLLSVVDDPFITTRKTRNVGLGLSLMKSAALRCDGNLNIASEKGKGTKVVITFKHNHIDRAPLGNMGSTMAALISREEQIDYIYTHKINDSIFVLNTKEIKEILGEVEINSPEIILWLQDYINENIKSLLSK